MKSRTMCCVPAVGFLAACCGLLLVLVGAAEAQDYEPPQGAEVSAAEHEAAMDALDELELIVIDVAPPDALLEEVSEESKPSETAMWVTGYWRWDSVAKKHVWVPGFWREPPPGLAWHGGGWIKTNEGWAWRGGYWASPVERELALIKPAPPVAKVESRPPKPGLDFVWASGCWKWTGTKYVWAPGQWKKAAAPGTLWVRGRYVKRPGGYVYVSGYWDHHRKARVAPPRPKKTGPPPKAKPPKAHPPKAKPPKAHPPAKPKGPAKPPRRPPKRR